MNKSISDDLIGYSAYDLYEQCYEYNENECYVADSPASMRKFVINAMLPVKNYRIDAVRFLDFLKNYGCSCGYYALEPKALERFKQAAKAHGIEYNVEEYKDELIDFEPKIFVVSYHGWQHTDEEEYDDEI